MTKDKAHSYDIGILGKLVQGEEGRMEMIATELSNHSIRLTVFVTDEKLKNNVRNMLHVDPILPPIKDSK